MSTLATLYTISHTSAPSPEAIQAFTYYVDAQYYGLLAKGYTFNFGLEYDDSFASLMSAYMAKSVKVFMGGTSSEWLPEAVNLKFRAVHDYHHYLAFSDFSFNGELAAFRKVVAMLKGFNFGPSIQREITLILFSEIVLQACVEGFPDQKLVYSELAFAYCH